MTTAGRGFTLAGRDDERLQCFWDGEAGEPFDGLWMRRDKTSTIVVSDDGEHIAYAGGRSGHAFVGRDGSEDPPCSRLTRSVPPVFSHAGAHLAYGAGLGRTSEVVPGGAQEVGLILDGEPVNTMPVAPIQAVFSPGGEHLAYVEMRVVADGDAEMRIVRDGSPGPWFHGMRNAEGVMQFSPDGARFAYCQVDRSGHSRWVVDDHAGPLITDVRSASFLQVMRRIGVIERPLPACFSPDGRRFAYAADIEGQGVAIVEGDDEHPRFRVVGRPVFSPDSRHLAYVAATASQKLCLVVDGTAGPEWPGSFAGDPVFSADSRHVAVVYGREDGRLLRKRHWVGCVVDGRVIAEVPGEAVWLEPVVCPDGRHVAWWYEHDDVLEMMVDQTAQTTEHIAYGAPVYTRSHHLVYAAIIVPGGRVTVLVDGRLGPLADGLLSPRSPRAVFEIPRSGEPNLPFVVSPDGEHVAWAGVFGEEARPVLDDRVGPPFDVVLDSRWGVPGPATWWAQRGDTVYRVTGSIEGAGLPVGTAR